MELREYRITFELYSSGNDFGELHEIPMCAKTLQDAISIFVEYIMKSEYKTIEIISVCRV